MLHYANKWRIAWCGFMQLQRWCHWHHSSLRRLFIPWVSFVILNKWCSPYHTLFSLQWWSAAVCPKGPYCMGLEGMNNSFTPLHQKIGTAFVHFDFYVLCISFYFNGFSLINKYNQICLGLLSQDSYQTFESVPIIDFHCSKKSILPINVTWGND